MVSLARKSIVMMVTMITKMDVQKNALLKKAICVYLRQTQLETELRSAKISKQMMLTHSVILISERLN
jgi:hypothetical protein